MKSVNPAHAILSLADQESVVFKGQVDKELTDIQAVMFAQADDEADIFCNTFDFDGAKPGPDVSDRFQAWRRGYALISRDQGLGAFVASGLS